MKPKHKQLNLWRHLRLMNPKLWQENLQHCVLNLRLENLQQQHLVLENLQPMQVNLQLNLRPMKVDQQLNLRPMKVDQQLATAGDSLALAEDCAEF